jgi:hypothetical protein
MAQPVPTLYENEFQNPQIFQQTISLFPEQSTLKTRLKMLHIFSGVKIFVGKHS